jgi:hypothetical protein
MQTKEEQINYLRRAESKDFVKFRDEIIKKLDLTWEQWVWLWDKLAGYTKSPEIKLTLSSIKYITNTTAIRKAYELGKVDQLAFDEQEIRKQLGRE